MQSKVHKDKGFVTIWPSQGRLFLVEEGGGGEDLVADGRELSREGAIIGLYRYVTRTNVPFFDLTTRLGLGSKNGTFVRVTSR